MLADPPRDIKIDRENKKIYRSLSQRFNKDDKDIFLFGMKAGFFYGTRLKIKKPQSLVQLSTLSDDEIKNMAIMAFSVLKDTKKMFDGKEVVKICEEFANGGIKKLYKLFMEEGAQKDDVRIMEDIMDELKERYKS